MFCASASPPTSPPRAASSTFSPSARTRCRSGASRTGWSRSTSSAASYDAGDLLPKIRDADTVGGKLYAAPFYGESSFTMYRTDLFKKASLTMPNAADLGFRARRGEEAHDKSGTVCRVRRACEGSVRYIVNDSAVETFGGVSFPADHLGVAVLGGDPPAS